MFDLVIVALLIASAGVMAFGLLLLARQLFFDPRQLPWIAWPTFVLLTLLLVGRWAKNKPGTTPPARNSVRGRILAAVSATKGSVFAKLVTSLAFLLLAGAMLFHSFWLVSAGVTAWTTALLADFVWIAVRDPNTTEHQDRR